MTIVRIPTPLRPLCGGQSQVEVEGPDVRAALTSLDTKYPGFLSRVQDDEGHVRRFVNVFVNADDIRERDGLATPVAAQDSISIVPAIAGGASDAPRVEPAFRVAPPLLGEPASAGRTAYRAHDPFYRDLYERHPVLAAIGGTQLVELHVFRDEFPDAQVFAKIELSNPGGSLKDRPVLGMLAEALRSGELDGRTVLDSSSGNAGIAYAMIGAVLDVPVELVLPGNASRERQERIRAHGATVVLTDPVAGYDEALREAHRRKEAAPDRYFMPDQYANDENWRAHHEGTGAEILEQTGGRLTHFVAGVGTGGSITGIGRRLKEHSPSIEVACVVPESFPGIEGLKPLERPEDVVPRILDASVIDRRVRTTIDDAYAACQHLARHGLFCGQSTGAYLHAVREILRDEPTARVVTLACDIGERYFSTRLWSERS